MKNIAHASIRTRDTDRAFGGIARNKNRTLRNISNLFQNMRRVFFVEKGCRFSSSYFPIRVKAVARKFRRCVIVFCASCVNAIQCDTCCNDYSQGEKQDFAVFPGLHFVLFCAKLWRGVFVCETFRCLLYKTIYLLYEMRHARNSRTVKTWKCGAFLRA